MPALWRMWLGDSFGVFNYAFLRTKSTRADSYPCPRECGCAHEIVEHTNGSLVAVCCCDPSNCDDIKLTANDVVMWELNTSRLGRAICKAFDCDARVTDLHLPLTWQIGAKFSNAVPVILTIQNERDDFRNVIAELVARWRQPFILFAPTSRFVDAVCTELLDKAGAGFFDLETNLVLTASGGLQTRKSGGELFQAFAPDAGKPIPETVAAQLFATIEKLDADERLKNPSVLQVFRLYCGRDLTAQAVADKCGCVKATVLNRLKKIHLATGKHPKELRAYSPFFKKVEDAITDSRAEYIHRKTLVHDIKESDDESE